MFYAASLNNSRTNINRVSRQNFLSKEAVVITSERVAQSVAVKGKKNLPGQVNLSKLRKQLV